MLVAEDERDVAELIRHQLTKDGYDPVPARTGTEALERALREKPDLIRLDLMIPEMKDPLRAKSLGAKVELPDVETVRGVGYRFREADRL